MDLTVKPPESGDDILETPALASGPYGARILKIRADERMQFKIYQAEGFTEEPGVEFVFGVLDRATREPCLQRAWPMKLKFTPRAKLYKFLTDLLGRAPAIGFNLKDLEGTGCLVKINLRTNAAGDKQYSVVEAVKPAVDEFGADHSDKIPALNLFPEVPDIAPKPAAEPQPAAPAAAAPAAPAAQPQAPKFEETSFPNPFTGEDDEIDF